LHQYEPVPQSLRAVHVKELRAAILEKLTYAVGKEPSSASDHDWFVATALAVRTPRRGSRSTIFPSNISLDACCSMR
jgi:hypothetical protein